MEDKEEWEVYAEQLEIEEIAADVVKARPSRLKTLSRSVHDEHILDDRLDCQHIRIISNTSLDPKICLEPILADLVADWHKIDASTALVAFQTHSAARKADRLAASIIQKLSPEQESQFAHILKTMPTAARPATNTSTATRLISQALNLQPSASSARETQRLRAARQAQRQKPTNHPAAPDNSAWD